MNAGLQLDSIPAALHWDVPAAGHMLHADGSLQMTAPPRTDLFVDPRGMVDMTNSTRLLFQPDEHFTLSAHARGDLTATYDAAVLMLYVDDRHWAKLCLELSPQGQPMIVSVVAVGL